MSPSSSLGAPSLAELMRVFSRLGVLGFGGPMATIAMMEEELVRKRGWLSSQRFGEMYAVCKLLPGPVSTQMAIYLGFECLGRSAGALCGFVFVVPSFLLVLGFSFAYVTYGLTDRFVALFSGMQAGALVVILLSTWQLYKPHRQRLQAWGVALFCFGWVAWNPRLEPLLILGFGAFGAWSASRKSPASAPAPSTSPREAASTVVGSVGFLGMTRAMAPDRLAQLFWTCFKAGAFTFGTGLAVVPLLEGDAVTRFGWLTHAEFMDGLAIGQITPGPVVITSTFIGFKTAGLIGAIVATIGMFLPSFINILLIVPRIWRKLAGTPAATGFTIWAIPAVVGAIAGATVRLGFSALSTPLAIGAFSIAFLLALRIKIPAWLLIPGTGIAATLGAAAIHLLSG